MEESKSKDKAKLRVAIVGCGRVAAKHLKALSFQMRKGRAELVGLCDSRPGGAEECFRKSGGGLPKPRFYEDLDLMLSAEKPNILAVTTPSGLHYEQGMKGLAAGCHLLMEKPICMTIAEAQGLIAEARQRDLKIALGHIYRYFPLVSQLQKDLADGMFGRILYGTVNVRWGHDEAYYSQAAWRGKATTDGGAVMNQCVHAVDLLQWLLGSGQVLEVEGTRLRLKHHIECEDFASATYILAPGIPLVLEGTTASLPAKQAASFEIQCEKGRISAGLSHHKIHASICDVNGKSLLGRKLWKEIKALFAREGLGGFLQIGNPHTAIYSDLIAAIREGRQPLADGEAGLKGLEMVIALYEKADEIIDLTAERG